MGSFFLRVARGFFLVSVLPSLVLEVLVSVGWTMTGAVVATETTKGFGGCEAGGATNSCPEFKLEFSTREQIMVLGSVGQKTDQKFTDL